jgi:hypothetical protein
MTAFLPDGQPLGDDVIVAGAVPEHPAIIGHGEHNFFLTFACPAPTAWVAAGSTTVRGTTFYPISHVYGPSQVAETITLTSDRTVTKGAEIQGGLGWSLGVLEAQAHVKLDGSVTTSMSETQQFTLPRGMSVYLAAQIIYRQTALRRTAFAGPNCLGATQALTVLTPINTAYLVARAH